MSVRFVPTAYSGDGLVCLRISSRTTDPAEIEGETDASKQQQGNEGQRKRELIAEVSYEHACSALFCEMRVRNLVS